MAEEKYKELEKRSIDLLVKFCKNNRDHIYKQFFYDKSHPFYDEEYDGQEASDNFPYDKTLKPENWELHGSPHEFKCGIRRLCFDCSPLDDQLRGYVFEKDGTILHVYVRGE